MLTRRPLPASAATAAVAVLAAVVTLVRLGTPADIVFDETFYVPDARGLLADGVEPGFAVHPPLGKWVIAAGIAVVGDHPLGWRIGGALLAVVAVVATVELTRRLTGRTWPGVVAGVLLTLDGAWLVPARTAMLDVTVAAAVTVGAWLLVVDHQRATARAADRPPHVPWRGRWPLAAAGVAFGVAAATKWSGLAALGAATLLATGWELAARRRRTIGRPAPADLAGACGRVMLALAVIPAVVYLAAFVPWMAADDRVARATPAVDTAAPPTVTDRLDGLWRYHRGVLAFHTDLDAGHPYRAPATTWLVQARPVVYFFETCGPDGRDDEGRPCTVAGPEEAAEIVALGNPALWWSGLVLLPVAASRLRRRDAAAVVPLTFLGMQLLPWLLAVRPVFSFYTTPLIPFLAVAVAVALAELDIPARRAAAVGAGLLSGLAAGAVAGVSGLGVPASATTAVASACLGAGLGGIVDHRRERALRAPPWPPRAGIRAALILLAAAVVLFGYFSPLWYAWPLPEDALRARWWLPGWV
jgi:dolichyl-phosphate-mannose-protein mannosyltransferase